MATNFKADGDILDLLAPYNVASGEGMQVGGIFAVALGAASIGAAVRGKTSGVWTLTKVGSQAWSVGDKVYWDNGDKCCTKDATKGQLIGVAVEAAGSGSGVVTGVVRLNGVAPATLEGPQTVIAALTMDAGITAATANGALVGSAGANPSQAEFNELAKEFATKVNEIITALKAAGIVASA